MTRKPKLWPRFQAIDHVIHIAGPGKVLNLGPNCMLILDLEYSSKNKLIHCALKKCRNDARNVGYNWRFWENVVLCFEIESWCLVQDVVIQAATYCTLHKWLNTMIFCFYLSNQTVWPDNGCRYAQTSMYTYFCSSSQPNHSALAALHIKWSIHSILIPISSMMLPVWMIIFITLFVNCHWHYTNDLQWIISWQLSSW